MKDSSREDLRAAFPQLPEHELDAIEERLKRYVSLAIAVAGNEIDSVDRLTASSAGGTVNTGKVDPSTLKNIG